MEAKSHSADNRKEVPLASKPSQLKTKPSPDGASKPNRFTVTSVDKEVLNLEGQIKSKTNHAFKGEVKKANANIPLTEKPEQNSRDKNGNLNEKEKVVSLDENKVPIKLAAKDTKARNVSSNVTKTLKLVDHKKENIGSASAPHMATSKSTNNSADRKLQPNSSKTEARSPSFNGPAEINDRVKRMSPAKDMQKPSASNPGKKLATAGKTDHTSEDVSKQSVPAEGVLKSPSGRAPDKKLKTSSSGKLNSSKGSPKLEKAKVHPADLANDSKVGKQTSESRKQVPVKIIRNERSPNEEKTSLEMEGLTSSPRNDLKSTTQISDKLPKNDSKKADTLEKKDQSELTPRPHAIKKEGRDENGNSLDRGKQSQPQSDKTHTDDIKSKENTVLKPNSKSGNNIPNIVLIEPVNTVACENSTKMPNEASHKHEKEVNLEIIEKSSSGQSVENVKNNSQDLVSHLEQLGHENSAAKSAFGELETSPESEGSLEEMSSPTESSAGKKIPIGESNSESSCIENRKPSFSSKPSTSIKRVSFQEDDDEQKRQEDFFGNTLLTMLAKIDDNIRKSNPINVLNDSHWEDIDESTLLNGFMDGFNGVEEEEEAVMVKADQSAQLSINSPANQEAPSYFSLWTGVVSASTLSVVALVSAYFYLKK